MRARTPSPQRRRSCHPRRSSVESSKSSYESRLQQSKGHEMALWSPKMKVAELRQACRERGLSAVGTKKELTEQLERQGWRPTSDMTTTTQFRMTFMQEVCNAVSMIVPTLVVAYYRIYEPPATAKFPFWNQYSKTFAFGTFLHLPFSFVYHILCAFNYFEDRVDCAARRLDQTLIHTVCIIYSYALSGIPLYSCGCGVVNAWYIAKLWMRGPHDNSFERRCNLSVGALLYMLPLVWRGDYVNFFGAFTSFWLVGSLAFVFNRLLGGWGHSFCHVIFGFLAYFLLMASAQLPDYLNKPGQSFYITQEDSWSLEKLFLNLETVIAVHM